MILETADEATGTFERCVFNRNESNLTPGGVGGALLLTYGSFLVSECTFWGSRATSVGSAIFFGAGAVGSVERSVLRDQVGALRSPPRGARRCPRDAMSSGRTLKEMSRASAYRRRTALWTQCSAMK